MLRFVFNRDRVHFGTSAQQALYKEAWIKGDLYLHNNAYTCDLNGDGVVYGELQHIHTSVEGAMEVEVTTDSGKITALVIEEDWNTSNEGEKIPSGNALLHHYLNEETTLYYFAYGSCMDHERFKLAKVDQYFQNGCKGTLHGYEMKYTFLVEDGSRADIVEESTAVTEGVCYRVGKEAIEYLYIREGVEGGWYRPTIVEVQLEQETVRALTFIVIQKSPESVPPLHYYSEIIRGAESYKLSENYRQKLTLHYQQLVSKRS